MSVPLNFADFLHTFGRSAYLGLVFDSDKIEGCQIRFDRSLLWCILLVVVAIVIIAIIAITV